MFNIIDAVGEILDLGVHLIADFFIFLGYCLYCFGVIIYQMLTPIIYVGTIIKAMIFGMLNEPSVPVNLQNIGNFIHNATIQIPHWTEISGIIGLAISIIFIIKILKTISK